MRHDDGRGGLQDRRLEDLPRMHVRRGEGANRHELHREDVILLAEQERVEVLAIGVL